MIEAQPKSKVAYLIGKVKRHKITTAVASVALVTIVIAGVVFAKPLLAWWFKPPSIAILPIVNTTGAANLDYVSDGLTESVITSLTQLNTPGKIPRLRVSAQNTIFLFKGKEIEPQEIGRKLGVDSVLAGKMFYQNNLRFFKFELINVADGSIAWSRQYSVGFAGNEEFVAMQNDIPKDVAAQLPLGLSDADRQILTRRYTQNPQAYDFYLKGRAEFRKITPLCLRKSIEYFQQAIDLDPNFAAAYWAMGQSYRTQGMIDERPQKEANEKAADLFKDALKIDNTLEVAVNALKLGELEAWNWQVIEKAGASHPGYSFWNGGYLIAMGRIDEQLEIENRILTVEPFNPLLNFAHARTLTLARRYPEAIAQYQKTLNLSVDGKSYFGPESPWVHLELGGVYAEKGMFAEAIIEVNKAKDLAEDSEAMTAMLGATYAQAGQKDEAIMILNRLSERADGGEYVPPLNIAIIYAALDDKDQAFVWLDKAFDDRMDRLRLIKTHPMYDPLRSDPRFAELIRRMGLPN